MSADAFVRPEKRAQYEEVHKAVQAADWRDYVYQVISDAMDATGGN